VQIDTNKLANKLMKQRDQKIAGRSAGLGDSIAKITKATGLDKLAKKMANAVGKADCGCDDRRDSLNRTFPYKK